jgi:Ankyrin repeats (3 copies)
MNYDIPTFETPPFVKESPIYQAVLQGEVEDVRSSLANKIFSWDMAEWDEDDYIFRQSLNKAIELDYLDIVSTMLQAHFGENNYYRRSWKPWYVSEALNTAALLGRDKIVHQILEIDKDNIHKISDALAHGVWSRNIQIMQMLIDAGASPNCETEWGTPMIAAARTGDLEIVQFLIKAGADPSKWVDMDGYESPLSAAAYAGHEHIFEYLLPSVTDESEINAAKKSLQAALKRKKAQNY